MSRSESTERHLMEKIRQLPPERIAEVENFVDFLRAQEQERRLTRAAADISGAAFARVWDNPDDAAFDHL